MKIDKGRRSVIILFGVITTLVLVFVLFLFVPKYKTLRKVKGELINLQAEIDRVSAIIGKNETLSEVINKFNQKLKELDEKLPTKEETTLSLIAVKANELGLEVVSIKPNKDVDSTIPVSIKGHKCKQMPIEIELTASYQSLGEYIKVLRREIPCTIRINSVFINKESEKDGKAVLSARIVMSLYLLN